MPTIRSAMVRRLDYPTRFLPLQIVAESKIALALVALSFVPVNRIRCPYDIQAKRVRHTEKQGPSQFPAFHSRGVTRAWEPGSCDQSPPNGFG